MLRDSIQTSNKYFKVLYGPLDHVFYITLHNRPYKNFVLYDESFRQIRKIDVSHVSSFQSRCIHSQSTVNVRNRKQTAVTTKYLLEIFFGTTNRTPLTFTTVSFNDCEILCKEIHKTFGVTVYSYGSLNTAFKNALKNATEPELITETHETFYNKLEKYQLYKDAHDLRHLYELAHLEADETTEPDAEISSKFPVVIEGDMEDGSFVAYRDIRAKNSQNNSVYKVEWYLSKEVGSRDEYFEVPSQNSDTFYISEYMIGHYLMVKVYRALKFNENRTFVFSTAERGPIYPNSLLCHHILINSSKKAEVHDALISTLDLDVLFSVVDKSNKFGVYEPFNHQDMINNFGYFQNFVKCSNDNVVKPEKETNVVEEKDAKKKRNEVSTTQSGTTDLNEVSDTTNNADSSDFKEEEFLREMGLNMFPDENVEEEPKKPNKIKLKVPSKEFSSQGSTEALESQDSGSVDEEGKKHLNFLFGRKATQVKEPDLKDLHEATTVSDLSDEEKVKTFEVDEYYNEEQKKKKKFSLFGMFKSQPKKPKVNPKKEPQPKKEKLLPKPKVELVSKGVGKVMNFIKGKKGPKQSQPQKTKLEEQFEDKEVEMENGEEKMVIKEVKDEKPVEDKNVVIEESKQDKKTKKAKPEKKSQPPKPNKKGKKVVYNRKYEKQMREKRAADAKKNESVKREMASSEFEDKDEVKEDPKPMPTKKEDKPVKEKKSLFPGKKNSKKKSLGKPAKREPKPKEQTIPDAMEESPKPKEKKSKWGVLGFLKKGKGPVKGQKAQPNPNNELITKKDPEQENWEMFMKYVDTIQFVPVKVKVCLNELVLTFGLASLNLKWKMFDVEKADQMSNDQFPSIQKQLENSLTLVYKTQIPIHIKLRTQSTFQRNVLFHSVVFNKYRTNYSIDRCERELESCYYNGVRTAYMKVCRAMHESKLRNEDQYIQNQPAVTQF